MENVMRDLKDQNHDRCTPRPDKSEIVDVLSQHGAAEGFSLEWIVSRFPQHIEGRR
jgi:hypothetical protein